MNISDYADIIQADLILRRYSGQENRWSATFEHSETKESAGSSILAGTYGNGKTPQGAIEDYVFKLSGLILIFNAMNKSTRREYGIPQTLTAD
mgnify:CR=1 FL=1|jgi:hypothetical protein